MVHPFENILFSRREETVRFILCLRNRQFHNSNKDKHIQFRVSSVGCCLFVTWVFGDTFIQDRRTVARFLTINNLTYLL